jgi:hypothetical protein
LNQSHSSTPDTTLLPHYYLTKHRTTPSTTTTSK